MDDPLTLDQLISAVLEGGATLGMLLLFGFVILKLPSLMQEAISKALAPVVESTRSLGEQMSRMQQDLERLSTLILLQQQAEAKRHSPAINTELQARLQHLQRRDNASSSASSGKPASSSTKDSTPGTGADTGTGTDAGTGTNKGTGTSTSTSTGTAPQQQEAA